MHHNVAVVCAVAAFKVNQYGLSTKRLLMIFRWKSDTAAIAQLPPVIGAGVSSHSTLGLRLSAQ